MHFFDLWRIQDPFHLKHCHAELFVLGACALAVKSLADSVPPFAIPWLCSFGALPVACADDPTRPVGPILHQQNRLANETLEPRPFFLIILPERGCIQSMDRSMFALHTNYMPQTTNYIIWHGSWKGRLSYEFPSDMSSRIFFAEQHVELWEQQNDPKPIVATCCNQGQAVRCNTCLPNGWPHC